MSFRKCLNLDGKTIYYQGKHFIILSVILFYYNYMLDFCLCKISDVRKITLIFNYFKK